MQNNKDSKDFTRIVNGDFLLVSGAGTVLDGSPPTFSGLLGVRSTNSVSQTRNLEDYSKQRIYFLVCLDKLSDSCRKQLIHERTSTQFARVTVKFR